MARILVVDDAATVRSYHRMVLEQAGHEVSEAENGLEALEKVLRDPVDLLLVDINMPKMDGYRFLREVRRDETIRAIPAVMISTEAEDSDKELAWHAGANTYLVKPAKPEVLQRLVALATGEVTA